MGEHNLARVRHVVAVAAGKGGVGKSTLTFNLALSLSRRGVKVGVIDADLYGPSLKKMFGDDLPVSQNSIFKERIVPAESYGIKFVSMAHFLEEGKGAPVRAPIANGIIKQFIHLVDWGDLDCLLIDFPPGTGDIQLTLIQEAPLSGAVLVTTPQEIALLDVTKACAMFLQMQVPLLGLVENMAYCALEEGRVFYPFGKGGGQQFAREEGIFFLGQVPLEAAISQCCDGSLSIFDHFPRSAAAVELGAIAGKITEQLESFEVLERGQIKNFVVEMGGEI